jgi:arginine/ornithine permease
MASPKLGMVNKRGIPLNALLITLAIAGLSLLSSVVAAKTVFVFLLSLAGLGAQIGWIAIAACLLAFRRSYIRKGGQVENLKFKVPLYPFIPILALIANCIVMISLAFVPEQRMALYCGGTFFIGCYAVYHFRVKKNKKVESPMQEVELTAGKKMVI